MPTLAGEQETVRTLVTDKQSAEVFAAAFGQRVAADDELLLLGQFHLDPRTTAATGLVKRVRPFGDQAQRPQVVKAAKRQQVGG